MTEEPGGLVEFSWKSLGDLVRRRREERGLSLRELAKETYWSFSLLAKWERGERRPSAEAISRLDAFLGAEGQIVAAGLRAAMAELAEVRGGSLGAKASACDEDDVERRAAIRLLAGIGSGAAVPVPVPETIFAQIERVLDERVDLDDWERTVAEYAYLKARRPVGALAGDLSADVIAVTRLIGRGHTPAVQAGLFRVNAGLLGLLAAEFSDMGNRRDARLAWRNTRQTADALSDRELAVWARAKEADAARWGGLPTPGIAGLVAEAIEIGDKTPSYGLFRAYTVRAELAALRGDRSEALASMREFTWIWEHLPPASTAPEGAFGLVMSGLAEAYLGWHEAYVQTLIGDERAMATAEQSISGYPASFSGPIALLRLMQAVALVRSRDIDEGLGHALTSIRTGPMCSARRHLIGQVLDALPEKARHLDAAQELGRVLEAV